MHSGQQGHARRVQTAGGTRAIMAQADYPGTIRSSTHDEPRVPGVGGGRGDDDARGVSRLVLEEVVHCYRRR